MGGCLSKNKGNRDEAAANHKHKKKGTTEESPLLKQKTANSLESAASPPLVVHPADGEGPPIDIVDISFIDEGDETNLITAYKTGTTDTTTTTVAEHTEGKDANTTTTTVIQITESSPVQSPTAEQSPAIPEPEGEDETPPNVPPPPAAVDTSSPAHSEQGELDPTGSVDTIDLVGNVEGVDVVEEDNLVVTKLERKPEDEIEGDPICDDMNDEELQQLILPISSKDDVAGDDDFDFKVGGDQIDEDLLEEIRQATEHLQSLPADYSKDLPETEDTDESPTEEITTGNTVVTKTTVVTSTTVDGSGDVTESRKVTTITSSTSDDPSNQAAVVNGNFDVDSHEEPLISTDG